MSRSAIQAKKQQKKKLSHAQRTFNSTIRKIEKEKKLLAEWQEMTEVFQQKQSGIYVPLVARYDQARAELTRRFDRFFERKSFSGLQREKMAHAICEITVELIPKGFDDLRDVHDRYSSMDFDTIAEEGKGQAEDMLRDLFESEFGVDLGDDFDMDRPEEMADRIAGLLTAEREQEAAGASTGKKKTASQQRKEAKAKEEEENISQSIKSVYRQLTTALHPDREVDELERGRKTELMQKVTRAYRDKDLLKLLELQLEVEQIDQTNIDGIADSRLKHFNKVLSRQLQEITMEVEQVSILFKQMAGIDAFGPVSPQIILQEFERDTELLERDVLELEEDLSDLTTVKGIQRWLKSYELPRLNPFDIFNSFGSSPKDNMPDDFDDLFSHMGKDFFR